MLKTKVFRLLLFASLFWIPDNAVLGQTLNKSSGNIIVDDELRHEIVSKMERMSVLSCSGNIIENGDFEGFSALEEGTCDAVDPPACSTLFEFGCTSRRAPFHTCNSAQIGDWWISHGTPEIWNPFGNSSALMWSGRGVFEEEEDPNALYGEGLFNYCYEFKAGATYHMDISMMSTGAPLTNVFIELANGIDGPNDYTNNDLFAIGEFYEIPSAIGNSQVIFSNPGFDANDFVNFSFTFTPDEDYSIIWIYPFLDSEPGNISLLYIDDVCISCVDPENTVVYTTANPLPELTTAQNLINAKQNAKVSAGEDVTFRCAKEILLEANFQVENNGDFLAFIDPIPDCQGTACAPANTLTENEEAEDRISEEENSESIPFIDEVKIYPNPSDGIFQVSMKHFGKSELTIFVSNLMGERILAVENISDNFSLDLSNQTKGVYFLHIQSGDEQTIKRLIVQ